MRILDSQFYLVTKFEASIQNYHLSIIPESELENVEWNGSTRLSPIWPIHFGQSNETDLAGRELSDDSRVCFLGPIAPPKVFNSLQNTLFSSLLPGDAWLTLGHYNFVFFLSGEEEVQVVREFCNENDCAAEFWRVLDQSDTADIRCDEIEYFEPERSDIEIQDSPNNQPTYVHYQDVVSSIDASIKQAFLEFLALRQTSANRSRFAFDIMNDDLTVITEFVPTIEQVLIGSEQLSLPDKQNATSSEHEKTNVAALKFRDQILNLNAGLSRHVSQALSGTSPIIQTECHFWPHSLLGTGIANLALRNLAAFVIESVNTSNYNYNHQLRLKQRCADIEAFDDNDGVRPISSLQLSDLEKLSLRSDSPKRAKSDFRIPNPITYYSGRDGFRYGAFTVSAPLLCIGGCNSKQWNLETISHELSHRVVSPKVQYLLLQLRDLPDKFLSLSIKELCHAVTENIEEAALVLLVNAVNLFEANRLGEERYSYAKENLAEFLGNGVIQNEHELEEKLVHIFDYYHFYNQEAEVYVPGIWQSWAVQPSIATKFFIYVERTAVALAVKHAGSQNWAELTYKEFLNSVKKRNFWHQTLFRDRLEEFLKGNRESVIRMLRRHWPLIALFSIIFKSESLATLIESESRDISHAHRLSLYDVTGLQFPNFTNPLKFTREMTTDKTPDSAKSAWLLSALAFGYLQSDIEEEA